MGISRSSAGVERVFDLLVAACALLVPLAVAPGLRDAFVLPKLLVVSAASALAVLAWAASERRPLSTPLDRPILALWCAAAASTAFSVDRSLSLFGAHGDPLYSVTGLAAASAAFYLGRGAGRGGLRVLARCSAAASLPVSAYTMLQSQGVALFGELANVVNRPLSTFGNPVALGAYLAFALPAAASLAFGPGEGRGWRWTGLAAVVLGLPALALSGTRGAWLAAAAGLAVLGWLARGPRPAAGGPEAGRPESRWRRTRVAPVLALLAAAPLVFVPSALRRNRLGAAGSDSARVEIWAIAWQSFRERPLLGWGPDTFAIPFRSLKSEALARAYLGVGGQNHAHDDWLQVLATLGLVGAAAYAWLHWALWGALAGCVREERSAAWACGALAAAFVGAKLNSPGPAVQFLGAVAAGCAAGGGARAPVEGARPPGGSVRLLGGALFALAAAWALAVSGWLAAADRQDRLGRRLRAAGRPREAAAVFERALALAPHVGAYRFDLANLLWDAAAASGAVKEPLLRRAAEVAADGARRSPADADAHRLLGTAELRRTELGGEARLREAREALGRSFRLDPTFRYTLEELARVAELERDDESRRDALERLARLQN